MEHSIHTKIDCPANRESPLSSDPKLTVPPTPQQSSIVAMTLFALLRGPILWICGVSLLSGVCISLWEHIPHGAFIPLVLFFVLGITMLWTLICCSLFGKDVYSRIVQPLVLKPVLLNATQYSLDEIFRTICDPTQLATVLSACWMVPVTLYTVPTTEQQRAQVLSAAGVLPPVSIADGTNQEVCQIFTQPGGWVSLLPEWFQKVAQPMISDFDENSSRLDHNHSCRQYCDASNTILREAKVMEGSMHLQDVTSATTVDEDDSDDDTHEAMHSLRHLPNPTSSKVRESAFAECTEPTARVSPKMESSVPHSEPELPELFCQIWIDMIQNKWDRICRRLQKQRSNMAITAMVTFTVLWLQIRYSPSARKMIRNVAHMLLTTSAGITFLGSTVAFLTPYFYQTWLKQHHESAPLGSNGPSPEHLSVLLSSLLSSLKNTIPKSMLTTKEIAKKMQVFFRKWKGTVAVLVLAYFRYQQQKRELRKQMS
jgi:hypothetical protein